MKEGLLMTITICANGLIMIPVKIRCELDINAGDSLTFFIGDDKEIIMCKTTSVQNILSSAAHKRKPDA